MRHPRAAFPRTALFLLSLLSIGGCETLQSSTGNNPEAAPTTPPPPTEPGTRIPEANVAACDYPTVSDPAVLDALAAGDGSKTSAAEPLLAAALATASAYRSQFDAVLRELYQLNEDGTPRADGSSLTSLSWNPTHDSALLLPRLGKNVPLLVSNSVASSGSEVTQEVLAIVGKEDAGRYLVFGGNPVRGYKSDASATSLDEQLQQLLRNGVHWLSGKAPGEPLKVVLAHLDESYWFPEESSVRAWLDHGLGTPVTYNVEDACDGAALQGCLAESPDLLIISQAYDELAHDAPGIASTMKQALAQGTPVLYLHLDGGLTPLGDELLRALSVDYSDDNYWSNQSITEFDGSQMLGWLNRQDEAIVELLKHLQTGSYSFEVSAIAAAPDENGSYRSEFADGAEAVRGRLNRHDDAARPIFASCENTFDKLLVLAGDRIRQDIRYPMSVSSTPTAEFLRAYFADHAVYNLRATGSAQTDRGNFDPKDLSQVPGTTVTISMESRKGFRSTGVYLLPGRAATITRKDATAVKTQLRVNSLLSRATHLWDSGEDAYPRPKYLSSTEMPLVTGQPLTISNPYGGPLQLTFDGGGDTVQVTFENVGQHPHWRSAADNDTFAARLASGTYNWVEVASPGFELHSRLDLYESTISDPRHNTPDKLAAAMTTYTFGEFHALAGYEGADIPVHPEISDWASDHGLELKVMDWVKHGNMDQAGCGSGCSGNPYDAYWSFDPLGHGDLHELGHGEERGVFRLTHLAQQQEGHTVTNWWPFYVNDRHFQDTGVGGDWEVDPEPLYKLLQSAKAAGNDVGEFSNQMNSTLAQRIQDGQLRDAYVFYLQAMLMARHHDVLSNGYLVVPRIILLYRAFDAALDDSATWLARRNALGFGSFSYEEASAITNNDFMFVALCFVTGLDYRDYFDMWGVAVGATARTQVAGLSYPQVQRGFFALGPNDHTHGALSTAHDSFQLLPIDGTTTWPL